MATGKHDSTRRTLLLAAAGLALVLGGGAALAQSVPAGYPADYQSIIDGAKSEGKVSIYTATDASIGQKLVDAFKAAYPGVDVEYNDLGTNGTYNRVISEAAAGQVGADIVWSSAMDQLMSLATQDYTLAYKSPEAVNIPGWADYKDLLYGTTVEPVGIIYNTKQLTEADVPKTRADLIKFLQDNKDKLAGKVASFDPEKSGAGFLNHTNDARATTTFWDLAKAFGAAKGKTYSATGAIKETVVSGENVLAFNVIGSYALDWVKTTPNLGVAFGTDYTAAFSRAAAVVKDGPHPNAGKLFLDFMLSKAGQEALAAKGLPSVRKDVTSGLNIDTLNERVGGNLKPITLDEGLLQYMDPKNRVDFFKKWKSALSGQG